ncbi:ABC transporter substrate-binding protein [Nonomuraea jiangxiensis]|uniref:NitT/TauT family transport system substrate-binding protein n=1 Tax=Nonomuraea jiangxiensis TaxID=633440 RepID=A0A1G8W996_9ACTN|nr:ABC transporter substrate-binding protein [Nonomuraea jiangxiensis]SDJ74315.1 NitT/TauT family transport system substrate-binding protein [Nonomuraea jiangxiensis]
MTRLGRVGALLAALFLVTACSDYPGDLSGGGSGPAGGSAGLTQIKVSDTAGMPAAFITYGVQRGFFKEQGLDVRMQTSAGGAAVIPALLNGGLDVAGSNVVSAVIAMNRGLPLTMVGSGTSTADDPEQDFSGIAVPAGSAITSAAGVNGKRIAVNTLRNINDIVIDASIRRAGVTPAGVKYVEMGFPDMLPALERGDVDAAMLIEPFLTMARSAGMRVVADPYTDARRGLQIGTYLMAAEKARQNPRLVSSFQAGVRRTAEAIRRDPATFRAALPKIAGIKPELAGSIHLPQWKGTTDRASVDLIATSMRRLGLTDRTFDHDRYVLK